MEALLLHPEKMKIHPATITPEVLNLLVVLLEQC